MIQNCDIHCRKCDKKERIYYHNRASIKPLAEESGWNYMFDYVGIGVLIGFWVCKDCEWIPRDEWFALMEVGK